MVDLNWILLLKKVCKMKKILNKIKYYFYLKKCQLMNYEIIYPPQGLGDILVLLIGLQYLKKQNSNKKFAIIVTKKHFKDLCKIFNKSYDELLFLPNIKKIPSFVNNISEKIYSKNSSFEKFEIAIWNSIGIKQYLNFNDIPKIDSNKKIDELFSKGIYKKGKTVLICPEANTSISCFPENFWLDCANRLKGKGYDPVFNSSKIYGNYPSILYDLTSTINFLNNAGHLLGFRSGLLDVLGCFSNAHQVIIYPNNWKKGDMPYLVGFDDAPNEKYMEDGSLNRLFPNKQFDEFIYDEKIDVMKYFSDLS